MSLSPITLINVGTVVNDGTGDPVRTAFQKTNNNFSYLTSYSITNNVSNNAIVDGTQGFRKLVLTANSTVGYGTVANVWINIPTTASDGQELKITSMIPITSCYVNQGNPAIKVIPFLSNSVFSSGNATVTLTYTTSTSTWMTF
jgi:hypothetical protein